MLIESMPWLEKLFNSRFWALVQKEINQILRNKQLIILLIFPPTIQLLIYGYALNPDVHNIKLGIVDYAHTNTSRELIAALTENRIFLDQKYFLREADLATEVEKGGITAGLIIPPNLSRNMAQDKPTEIQVFIDGVDANQAGIASGYLNQIFSQFNRQLTGNLTPPLINPQAIFLYNPGLRSSWFFVPGVLGVVLTLISSLTSSITVVKEKDLGTLEQLLMTPAIAWEILFAKITPLFILLLGDVVLALSIGKLVFKVPFQGSLFLFFFLSGIYLFVGISIGIMLATLCWTQQQVVLTSFFINLPMIQLSGAIAPIESMPTFFQYISLFDPLRHYVAITRGILLKGVGLEVLFPHAIALVLFAVVLMSISVNRFRSQLS